MRLTLAAFRSHNASRFGAALAFYIVFSIAPTLLLAISLVGSLVGRGVAEHAVLDRISISFGPATGSAIKTMLRNAAPRSAGWLPTILGLSSLYFSLSGVYREIDDALRTIWLDNRKPKRGLRNAIEHRIGSLLFVLGAVVVVVLSVIADAAVAATGKYAASRLLGGEWLWHALQLVASTAVLTALFAAVFRYLPRARATWRDVRVGAMVTALLFVAGKFALGIYLGKAAVGTAFGAAGSIVVVLLWSYWSAQIFFFGLEFTHVYAQERGGGRR